MSETSNRPLRIAAWSVLALALTATVVLFARSQLSRSNLPVFSQVQPFVLTNQFGQVVTMRDLLGRVWIADIIFTRCGGPCPKMTEEMSKLQKAFAVTDPLAFVTLTTDPGYDSPAVLKAYGEKFSADHSRWYFLTGATNEIKGLAIGSLKLAAVEKEEEQRQNENDLFIHSTIFVLVDKAGRMRGIYESLEPGFHEKIRADIQGLLRETP